MLYTITASHGHYDDRCVFTMYACTDLEEARTVLADLKRDISAALTTIALVGQEAIGHCEEPIWEVAMSASWDGEVHLSISCMVMGKVSSGADFIESETASSRYNGDVTAGDVTAEFIENTPVLTKYEVLALPYEQKFFGHRP